MSDWKELLQKFRALGGIAENICLKDGENGRGIFPKDKDLKAKIFVPEKQLKTLQTLEIWLERHHPTLGAMQYHPGARWLKDNGHDPRLLNKVHLPRAASLLSRQQILKHPAVILH